MKRQRRTRVSNRESARENPIMARHQRMPTEEAGYTYAVVPTAIDRLTRRSPYTDPHETVVGGNLRLSDSRLKIKIHRRYLFSGPDHTCTIYIRGTHKYGCTINLTGKAI
jgi:hypothetical protein